MYYYAYLPIPDVNPDHAKLYLYAFTWNPVNNVNIAFGVYCSGALLLTGPDAKKRLLSLFPNIQFQNV